MKKVFQVVDNHEEFGGDYGLFNEGKQLDKIKQLIQSVNDNGYEHYLDIEEVSNGIISEEEMNDDLEYFEEFIELNFEDAFDEVFGDLDV